MARRDDMTSSGQTGNKWHSSNLKPGLRLQSTQADTLSDCAGSFEILWPDLIIGSHHNKPKPV